MLRGGLVFVLKAETTVYIQPRNEARHYTPNQPLISTLPTSPSHQQSNIESTRITATKVYSLMLNTNHIHAAQTTYTYDLHGRIYPVHFLFVHDSYHVFLELVYTYGHDDWFMGLGGVRELRTDKLRTHLSQNQSVVSVKPSIVFPIY